MILIKVGSGAEDLKPVPQAAGFTNTHHELVTGLKLGLDFPADVVLGDTQVLPDFTVVAHQRHVVIVDVDQLWDTPEQG